MRLILTSLLAVFTVSGALAQQLTVTIPGGHDREWYEHHGYFWHDGQWYRGEDRERHEYREHHQHNGYWKDGHYYRTRMKTTVRILLNGSVAQRHEGV